MKLSMHFIANFTLVFYSQIKKRAVLTLQLG